MDTDPILGVTWLDKVVSILGILPWAAVLILLLLWLWDAS